MGNIQDLLAQILSARYGRDVRQSIHDAIETCYEDGHAGAIDLEARTLLGDTDISEISETVTGAVVELGGAVDEAVSGLIQKQNLLNKGSYTGNIDDLKNSNDLNGVYLFSTSTASGTMPSSSGYYYMIVLGALQIAYKYNANAVDNTIVAYRIYLNNTWSIWRSATFTV